MRDTALNASNWNIVTNWADKLNNLQIIIKTATARLEEILACHEFTQFYAMEVISFWKYGSATGL